MSQSPTSQLRPLPQGIENQLRDFRRAVRRIKLAEAVLAAVCGWLMAYLVTFGIERFIELPSFYRTALLLLGALGATLYLPYMLHRWVWRTRRSEQVARLLKGSWPALGDRVLSVVELAKSREEQSRSPMLIAAAMAQVERQLTKYDLTKSVPNPRHKQWAWLTLLPIVVTISVVILMPQATWNALIRFANPWTPTPRFTLTRFAELPSEWIVPYAEPFQIRLELDADSNWNPSSADAWMSEARFKASRQDQSYVFNLPGQFEPQSIRVRCGDAWGETRIVPTLRPELESLHAEVNLPSYLHYPAPVRLDLRAGGASILRGSQVTFEARIQRELEVATVDSQSATMEGNLFRTPSMVIDSPRTLEMDWTDKLGLRAAKPLLFPVRCLEDMAPTITCDQLSEQRILLHSELLTFEVDAQDDFGMQHVGIEWRGVDDIANPDGTLAAKGERLIMLGDPQQRRLRGQASLSCSLEKIEPQLLQIRAFTEDHYPGRGRVYSVPYLIKVMSAEEHAQWIAEQLRRWKGKTDAIYDEELRLLEGNRELRRMEPSQRDQPESRRRMAQQATEERANAERLQNASQQGKKLLEQALRNEEIHAKQIEKWADALQRLNELAEDAMPDVAKQLDRVAKSAGASTSNPSSNPANSPNPTGSNKPRVPELKDDQSSPESKKSDASARSKNQDAKQDAPPSPLTIPETQLGSVDQGENPKKPSDSKTPEPTNEEPIDRVVQDHTRLVEEFRNAKEAFEQLMMDFENSTFVKRFKAAAKSQRELASRINRMLGQTFGLSASDAKNGQPDSQQAEMASVVEAQKNLSNHMRNLASDLQAYQHNNPATNREAILQDMDSLNMQVKLQEMPERLGRNLRGDTLHRSEFWADTFDRWGEELSVPSPGGGSSDSKSRDSLPPAILLEVLRIIEEEMDLRDETRTLNQSAPKDFRADKGSAELLERATAQAVHQMAIQERTLNVLQDIRALPNAEQFNEEIGKVNKSIEAMDNASGMLTEYRLGPDLIAAETEAIEALLATRRGQKGGGGGSSPGDGSNARGTTRRSPLDLVGPGSDASSRPTPRQAGESSGKTGRDLPPEYREGLDAFFNSLNRNRKPSSTGAKP